MPDEAKPTVTALEAIADLKRQLEEGGFVGQVPQEYFKDIPPECRAELQRKNRENFEAAVLSAAQKFHPQQPTPKLRWRSARTEKPNNGEFCHIRGEAGFISLNLPYNVQAGGWLEIFATPEAGAVYSADNGVLAWIPAMELDADLPDEIE